MSDALPNDHTPVFSEFADDPEYQDLLEMFLESLEEQRQELMAARNQGQWEELGRKAHQLKGAGGGYGFPGLTEKALALETCCKARDEDAILPRLDELFAYIDRLHA